jgi:hypothetical protein
MLQAMSRYLFLLLLLLSLSVNAEIYKWVDEYGNVHYSDSGKDGAQQVELSKGNSYAPSEAGPTSTTAENKENPPGYSSVTITKPRMNEVIRSNVGQVEVAIEIEPGLRADDTLTLYLDGRISLKNQTQTTFVLNNVERGSHTLRTTVIDKNGAVLIASKSVIFHLYKETVEEKDSQPQDNSDAFKPDYTSDSGNTSDYDSNYNKNYNDDFSKNYNSSGSYEKGAKNYNKGIPSSSGTHSSGSSYKPNYKQ